MPAPSCTDESIECSLLRIADATSGDWTWVDWMVSIGLPFAGIAASILIGIASIRLTVAANRISARAMAAEEEKEGQEGRERFVALLLEWLEIHWAEYAGTDAVPASAEAKLQAALKVHAASINRRGVDSDAAARIFDAGERALKTLKGMPVLEARATATFLKSMVSTAAHSYLALPDQVDDNIVEFDRRLKKHEERAMNGTARMALREMLLQSARPDGSTRSPEEVEALLDAFEAHAAPLST